jgi:hypothetical protein
MKWILLLLFSNAAFASVAVPTVKHAGCDSAIIAFLREIRALHPDIAHHEDYDSSHDEQTVFFERELTNSVGQPFLVVYRAPDDPWFATYTSKKIPDVQGNPRAILMMTGPNGEQLGFRQVSNTQLMVPDLITFNSRCAVLNTALVNAGSEAIPLQFHYQNNTAVVEYTYNFTELLSLPAADRKKIGTTGISNFNHFIHDISFHYATIGLPAKALRIYAERMRFNLAIINRLFSDPKLQEVIPAEELAEYKKDFVRDMASAIDKDTASLAPILVKPDIGDIKGSIEFIYRKIYENSKNPEQWVRNTSMLTSLGLWGAEKIAFSSALERAISEVSQSYQPIHQADFRNTEVPTIEEFCGQIRQRREEIRNALATVAADPSTRVQLPHIP